MAASFKIPTSLKRKAKRIQSCQSLSGNFSKKKISWVAVRLGPYTLQNTRKRSEKVVAKNNNVESIDSKSCFEKEASLLNSTKGHRNIIRFLEFSIMTNNDGVFLLRFSPVWSCKKSLHSRRFCPFRRRV